MSDTISPELVRPCRSLFELRSETIAALAVTQARNERHRLIRRLSLIGDELADRGLMPRRAARPSVHPEVPAGDHPSTGEALAPIHSGRTPAAPPGNGVSGGAAGLSSTVIANT